MSVTSSSLQSSSSLRYEIRVLLHAKINALSDEEIDAVVMAILANVIRDKLKDLGGKS